MVERLKYRMMAFFLCYRFVYASNVAMHAKLNYEAECEYVSTDGVQSIGKRDLLNYIRTGDKNIRDI
jgi:hypothetical protein